MAINKVYNKDFPRGGFRGECDVCGDEITEVVETFDEAVQAQKDAGARNKKDDDGNWYTTCENCLDFEGRRE